MKKVSEVIISEKTLSENFISEFKDKLGWDRISKIQKLSDEFKDKLEID